VRWSDGRPSGIPGPRRCAPSRSPARQGHAPGARAAHCVASHRLRACPPPPAAGTVGRYGREPRRGAGTTPSRPPVGHAHVCRSLQCRGEQRAVPPQPREGPDRPLRRLRPAHPDRLRPRPPPVTRRGGQGRCPDQPPRRHAGAVRRHPAGRDEHLHDDQRHGDVDAGALPGRGRGAGRRSGAGPERVGPRAGRHDAERHHQGVPLPGDLLPSHRSRRCGSSPTWSPTPCG